MCIIVFKPEGEGIPDNSILKNCWNNNQDGAGLMFRDHRGMIHVHKGFMDLKSLNNCIEQYNKKYDLLNADMVIHFRYATHGAKEPGCTHPFPITGDPRIMQRLHHVCTSAIAHNGVISAYAETNDKTLSDTMLFIKDLANKRNKTQIIKNTEGKFALMTRDKTIIFGEWVDEKGSHYSNTGYKPGIPISRVYSIHTYPFTRFQTIGVSSPKKARDKWGNTDRTLKGSSYYFCDSCGNITHKNELKKYGDRILCSICYDEAMIDEYLTYWGE